MNKALKKKKQKQKTCHALRWPGIEPGSTAWKAAMLTTIPPSHGNSMNICHVWGLPQCWEMGRRSNRVRRSKERTREKEQEKRGSSTYLQLNGTLMMNIESRLQNRKHLTDDDENKS